MQARRRKREVKTHRAQIRHNNFIFQEDCNWHILPLNGILLKSVSQVKISNYKFNSEVSDSIVFQQVQHNRRRIFIAFSNLFISTQCFCKI